MKDFFERLTQEELDAYLAPRRENGFQDGEKISDGASRRSRPLFVDVVITWISCRFDRTFRVGRRRRHAEESVEERAAAFWSTCRRFHL